MEQKEICRVDALTARQNCNRNEFNSTKYFGFFSWSASISLSLLLILMFSLARSQFFGILACAAACMGVISRYVMRSYHLHGHFYDLEMTLPATVCGRWLSSIWNDHQQPTKQPSSQRISRKTVQIAYLCVRNAYLWHTIAYWECAMCVYMRMWLHDNSNNNFIFWANLFAYDADEMIPFLFSLRNVQSLHKPWECTPFGMTWLELEQWASSQEKDDTRQIRVNKK